MTEEWETEPDSKDFEAYGLPCAMRRNSRGVWCGYVGVGPTHPAYGAPPTSVGLEAHGGIYFAIRGEESRDFAHGFYWFGFDCGHSWDIIPNQVDVFGTYGRSYRNEAYVTREAKNLARQLAEMVVKEATD